MSDLMELSQARRLLEHATHLAQAGDDTALSLTLSQLSLSAATLVPDGGVEVGTLPGDVAQCVARAADLVTGCEGLPARDDAVRFAMDLTDLAHEMRRADG